LLFSIHLRQTSRFNLFRTRYLRRSEQAIRCFAEHHFLDHVRLWWRLRNYFELFDVINVATPIFKGKHNAAFYSAYDLRSNIFFMFWLLRNKGNASSNQRKKQRSLRRPKTNGYCVTKRNIQSLGGLYSPKKLYKIDITVFALCHTLWSNHVLNVLRTFLSKTSNARLQEH